MCVCVRNTNNDVLQAVILVRYTPFHTTSSHYCLTLLLSCIRNDSTRAVYFSTAIISMFLKILSTSVPLAISIINHCVGKTSATLS